MYSRVPADNQPIDSRFGESVWLTSFITPDNPDVILKHQELTEGISALDSRITAQWEYVARFPYRETLGASLRAGGKSFSQRDAWFFPAEEIRIGVGNCANRSFLLASLLKNDLPAPGQVYCVFGELQYDGIGSHAWVEAIVNGQPYTLETTIQDIDRALIPSSSLDIYRPKIYFDEKGVYVVNNADPAEVINARFGLCAIPFLRNYLCEKCLELEV